MHRLIRRVAAACLLVLLGLLVGVLAAHTHVRVRVTRKPVAPATVAPVISCPGTRVTMSCVLQHQAPPLSTARTLRAPVPGARLSLGSTSASESAAGASIYGVDFGWGSMSAAGLRAIGARFAASYLSPAPNPKNWTLTAVRADHAAGIATVAVWEGVATQAQEGYAAGVTQAEQARAEAAALGDTTGAIPAAVDCDCTGPSILGFFEGWHHVLGVRSDAYGGYSQILYLYDHHLVGHENWQTYAWSGGAWLPASIAPLEQYLNGNAFDNDRAIAPLYGQWPAPAVNKPTGRVVCIGRGAQNTRTCRTVRADIARWQHAATASGRVYAARRCATHQALLTELERREAYFAGKLRRQPRIKHAFREGALRSTRAAVARQRHAVGAAHCGVFSQRVAYFDAKILAARRRYS